MEMTTRKYSSNDVCAVIVSYNPSAIMLENLTALIPQTGKCLIVDNGSQERDVLDSALDRLPAEAVFLGDNKGIGTALNKGLEYCRNHGYTLILTMDQDTVLKDGAVEALLKTMNESGAVSVGINWDDGIRTDTPVDYLITSGNLLQVEPVMALGGYDEELFIDSVDFDISLRLKDAGYTLLKVAAAGARHNLGETEGRKILGLIPCQYNTHSAARYFYISRNHYYLIDKYREKHRNFCRKKSIVFFVDRMKILLFDKERKEKIKAIRKGKKAYLNGKKK